MEAKELFADKKERDQMLSFIGGVLTTQIIPCMTYISDLTMLYNEYIRLRRVNFWRFLLYALGWGYIAIRLYFAF